MKIYPFKASYPNLDLIASPDSFFQAVSKEYTNFRNAGFFETSSGKALYIYRIEGVNTYTGIIGSNEISDIEEGKILGHEHTITEKEQTMMSLMLMRKAMIKPVLLAYEGHSKIADFISKHTTDKEPILDLKLSLQGERHKLWAINNTKDIEEIKKLFAKHIPKAYIADGHHRAAITARLVKKNYLHDHDDDKHPGLLCAFFPFSDLTIYDFSRVIDFSSKMTETRFMASISKYFDIQLTDAYTKPTKKNQLTMLMANEWYLLEWKSAYLKNKNKKTVVLDVDMFNDFVLKQILGIVEIKTSTEVKYIEGISDPSVFIQATKMPRSAGFYFYPVTKEDVITTSEAGNVLPPKSTWFEPRMKNGLVIKEF